MKGQVDILKKSLRIIAAILVAVIVVCAFAGCEKPLDKAILGSWQSPDAKVKTTVEFREDGTATFDFGSITILGFKLNGQMDGTYTLDVEKEPAEIVIVPKLPIGNIGITVELKFTVTYEEGVLKLKNDDLKLEYAMVRTEDLTQSVSDAA